jgi:hypothetical protein
MILTYSNVFFRGKNEPNLLKFGKKNSKSLDLYDKFLQVVKNSLLASTNNYIIFKNIEISKTKVKIFFWAKGE